MKKTSETGERWACEASAYSVRPMFGVLALFFSRTLLSRVLREKTSVLQSRHEATNSIAKTPPWMGC